MPKDKAAELEQLCDRLYLIDYVELGFKEFNPDLDGKRNWQPQPKAIGFRARRQCTDAAPRAPSSWARLCRMG